MINVSKVVSIEGSVTLKVLSIEQYYSTEIFSILPSIALQFFTLQEVQITLQIIVVIVNSFSFGGVIYLREVAVICCNVITF